MACGIYGFCCETNFCQLSGVYSVFQVGCPEEIKMGVVLVCTSNHCWMKPTWDEYSSGCLYNQGQLPFLISSGQATWNTLYCSLQVGWKSASCKLQSLSKQFYYIEPLLSYHNDSSLNGTVYLDFAACTLPTNLQTAKVVYKWSVGWGETPAGFDRLIRLFTYWTAAKIF